MELFYDLSERRHTTDFCTTDWAIAELYQSALDYRIAIQMIRDGRNPRFFQTQKQQYALSENEKEEIALSLETFIHHLRRKKKVMIWDAHDFTYEDVCKFSLRYGIEAPDALHLCLAKMIDCQYFLTVDEPLTRAGIKEIQVMFPSTFRQLPMHEKH
jgi:predicted nucleic acid-binding protein